jgi:plastocyanin
MRRREVLQVSAVAIGGIAGCLGGSPASSKTVEMTDDLVFRPAEVTVAQGGTVTWENVGSVGHTVTAYEDRIPNGATFFASGGVDTERGARNDVTAGLIGEGETYTHTFDVAGTYEYFCIPHESTGMVGTVEVG